MLGGLVLVLLDSMVNFRLEYLYPVLMFVRSVYDSYKYQGFVSEILLFKDVHLYSLVDEKPRLLWCQVVL